ncbi:CD3324 family protein [Paenibacillus sp.]|uniref:CD3324 family protein n=1 Tax=Paenibacillus sp. TaxID=58172 RepID=UPI002D295A6A|nr:CD3324 family protein [Paenibacillus sp.]HZG57178.1 CD3324 family protein [Paenibacillus sp.]
MDFEEASPVRYVNAKDVLPPRLLKELQQFVQGELVYIPKGDERRAGWGERSGARREIAERNLEISRRYASGWTVQELERSYHLSGESIRKIVLKTK